MLEADPFARVLARRALPITWAICCGRLLLACSSSIATSSGVVASGVSQGREMGAIRNVTRDGRIGVSRRLATCATVIRL